MSDEETKEEKELDLTSPDVVTKYKLAAEIANSKSDPFLDCVSSYVVEHMLELESLILFF